MDIKLMRQFDLNLLVSLYTLLEFKNVTHAAQALNISQPALSAQLLKLRKLFHDELLIPHPKGKGMMTTTKADALRLPLKQLIDSLDTIQKTEPNFNPDTDERVFKIAISNVASVSLVQPLVKLLTDITSTQLQIEFIQYQQEQLTEQWEQQNIDLIIDLEENLPEHFPSLLLLDEDFVVCFSEQHALAQSEHINLEDYCTLSHVIVNTTQESLRGYIDHVLQAMGYTRKVKHSVSHFILALECLSTTDFVCTLPRPMALHPRFHLRYHELPFHSPRYKLRLMWHPKNQANSAVVWLRQHIFDTVRKIQNHQH